MKEETKAKKTKEETTPKKVRANPMSDSDLNQNTGVEDQAYCSEHTSDESESIIKKTSEEQEKMNNFIDNRNPQNNDAYVHRTLNNINFLHNTHTEDADRSDDNSDGVPEFDGSWFGSLDVGEDDEVLDGLDPIGTNDILEWDKDLFGESTQGLLKIHTTGRIGREGGFGEGEGTAAADTSC